VPARDVIDMRFESSSGQLSKRIRFVQSHEKGGDKPVKDDGEGAKTLEKQGQRLHRLSVENCAYLRSSTQPLACKSVSQSTTGSKVDAEIEKLTLTYRSYHCSTDKLHLQAWTVAMSCSRICQICSSLRSL
jgi:hypothetical protein